MTRSWILLVSPVVFTAGLVLVHCSSSSSPGAADSGSRDAGHKGSSGSSVAGKDGGGGSKGSSEASSSGGASSEASSGEASSGEASSHGSGGGSSTAGSGTGTTISCGTPCAVPANRCCATSSSSANCIPAATACSAMAITCFGAADCTNGQICCLDVKTSGGEGTMSCQTGPKCPAGTLGSAEVCRTSSDCASGDTCVDYTCEGHTFEACSGTFAGLMSTVCKVTGSGSGSSSGSGS